MIGLTHDPHSALICGKTKSGKTQFVLDELLHPETGHYRGTFKHVFVLCPNWQYNMTYHSRPLDVERPRLCALHLRQTPKAACTKPSSNLVRT
jgi:hypothetical protein